MKKIINGKLELVCNAATPLVCKNLFGLDVLTFFENVDEKETAGKIETLEKVTYVMAMQAIKPLPEVLTMKEGFLEWLAGFDFDEMTEKIIPEAIALWVGSNKGTVELKNPEGPR